MNSTNYSPLFVTLQVIQKDTSINISGLKLTIASKIGASGSLGARLVRYLIGCDLSSLTQLAQAIFKNPNVNAQSKKDLANQMRDLAHAQKAQGELDLQGKAGSIRLQAEVKYFGKLASRLDDIINGKDVELRPFKDPTPSLACRIYKFVRAWLLYPLFGLNIHEVTTIIDHYLSNGKTKLPSYLKSHIDPKVQNLMVPHTKFIALTKAPNDEDLEQIRKTHRKRLEKGESLIIRYQEGNILCFRILTPQLNPAAAPMKKTAAFEKNSWQTIMPELAAKVQNERKNLLNQAFPVIYNHSLLNALDLPISNIDLTQSMEQLKTEVQGLQNNLFSKFEENLKQILKMADALDLILFQDELSSLARSSNLNELYSLAWNENGVAKTKTFNSLQSLRAFLNPKYFEHQIKRAGEQYLVKELPPEIGEVHSSKEAMPKIYSKIFICKQLTQREAASENTRYAVYFDPFSGTLVNKKIDISTNDVMEELNQFKQSMESSLQTLKAKEEEYKVALSLSRNPVPCPIRRLNGYRIEKEESSNPTYNIYRVIDNAKVSKNLFGWNALESKLKELIIDSFVQNNSHRAAQAITPQQRDSLPKDKIGIGLKGQRFALFRTIPESNPPALVSVTIEDLDKDFDKGLDRLERGIACTLEHRLTSKTTKKVSRLTRIDAPQMPQNYTSANLSKLLDWYDKINFSNPKAACYVNPKNLKDDGSPTTKENLRKGLNTLVNAIQGRLNHQGVPTNETAKAKYYNILERYMCNIVDIFTQKLEDSNSYTKNLEAIQSHILTLAEAGLHCGGRWMSEASQLYNGLTGQWEQAAVNADLETNIHIWIDQIKSGILEQIRAGNNHEHSAHGYVYIRKALASQGYEVPDGGAGNYDDVYSGNYGRNRFGDADTVVKAYEDKINNPQFYLTIQDQINAAIKNNNTMDLVLNALRKGIAWTSEDKASLKEEEFLQKKDALRKLQDEPLSLTEEDIKALTRVQELKNNPQLLPKLQWIRPEMIRDEALKAEVIKLKKTLTLLVQQKPDALKAYEELLENRGYKLVSIQDQLNALVQRQQENVQKLKDQKLIDQGLLILIPNPALDCDDPQITIQGVASLLKQFGFVEEELIRGKDYYHGQLSEVQLARLLRNEGEWLVYEEKKTGQPIIARLSQGRIELSSLDLMDYYDMTLAVRRN